MALITGWGRGTWSEGAWNSPLSVALTGVSAATAAGSVAVASESNLTLTGVSAATATGSVEVKIGVPLTGVSAAAAVGTVLIWQEIVPGQDAEWNPITYTQSPNWTKIAA